MFYNEAHFGFSDTPKFTLQLKRTWNKFSVKRTIHEHYVTKERLNTTIYK